MPDNSGTRVPTTLLHEVIPALRLKIEQRAGWSNGVQAEVRAQIDTLLAHVEHLRAECAAKESALAEAGLVIQDEIGLQVVVSKTRLEEALQSITEALDLPAGARYASEVAAFREFVTDVSKRGCNCAPTDGCVLEDPKCDSMEATVLVGSRSAGGAILDMLYKALAAQRKATDSLAKKGSEMADARHGALRTRRTVREILLWVQNHPGSPSGEQGATITTVPIRLLYQLSEASGVGGESSLVESEAVTMAREQRA